MLPINVPPIVNTGIVVYFPQVITGIINLNIYYSKSNPLLDWVNCDKGESLIYKESSTVNSAATGVLFTYESDSDLEYGFYRFQANLYNFSELPKTGQLVVGITQDMPRLVIGVPYSVYSPIILS